jgi:hypothetical protein
LGHIGEVGRRAGGEEEKEKREEGEVDREAVGPKEKRANWVG